MVMDSQILWVSQDSVAARPYKRFMPRRLDLAGKNSLAHLLFRILEPLKDCYLGTWGAREIWFPFHSFQLCFPEGPSTHSLRTLVPKAI